MISKIDKKVVVAKDLKELLSEKSDMLVVDLLPPEHFSKVHIPNAENACVFFVSFLEDLAAVVPDKLSQVVVYGSSIRSRDITIAVEKMARAGYQNIQYLEGGLEEWREAGFALDGDAVNLPDDPQTTLSLYDGRYIAKSTLSQVEWVGRNPNSRHMGTVDIAKGVVEILDGKISGLIEVDMNSIHNTNLEGDELQPVLEAHLRSDDFFFTQMFPKAVFDFKGANLNEPGGLTAPNFHVKGQLTLRGITAPLEFDTVVSSIDDDSIALEAHFDIDRTCWDIIYGSTRFFEHLGMHKVFDLVSLQLYIVATR
jgi:rhodanese-related sulfurtransferase